MELDGFDLRMWDSVAGKPADGVQLYLTVSQARQLRHDLDELLADPEARNHFHLSSHDFRHDFSCSIVTARKLAEGKYTDYERSLLGD